MNATSFGNILGNVLAVATAQPEPKGGIWRGSYSVADERSQVGRIFGDGTLEQSLDVIEAIVKTAKAWARHFKPTRKAPKSDAVEQPKDAPAKEPEQAPRLTLNMIETLEQTLRSYMDFKTGACEATYEGIMGASGFARATIVRHLKALRQLGWFDWVRRTSNANGRNEQTANSYFFEIGRLPLEAQIHLRQLLKEKGITLKEHTDRAGSGPVPNRAARLAERLANGFAVAADFVRGVNRKRRDALMADAAFVRSEMELFGDVPTDQWASIRHPGDLAAQEAYSARLGIPSFGLSESQASASFPPYRT
jgi:hypothetical protein